MKAILPLVLCLFGTLVFAGPPVFPASGAVDSTNLQLADFAGRNPVQASPLHQLPESGISTAQRYLTIMIPILLVAGLVFGIASSRFRKRHERRRRRLMI